MTALTRLVDAAWDLRPTEVPASAADAACRQLLDGLGCAVAAVRRHELPAVDAITALATAPEQADVVGLVGQRRPTHVAAFANGCLVHALDFDDTHAGALVHPTAIVLPTAFAVGQEVGADGATILHAAVLGYETIARLGAAAPHGFHARGLHATSIVGPVAAALVASWLRILDRETAVHALGIAASTSSGLLEFLATGASTKQLHPGWAAQAGIVAASLASAGGTGPATALEGQHGLYRAMADLDVTPDEVLDEFGVRWEVERVTTKPYPVCQLSHATMDAALTVRPKLDDLTAIDEVVAHVPREALDIVCEPAAQKMRPRTAYDAKFSLPWSVASVLVDGHVAIDAVDQPARDRPEVLDLARRVRVVATDPGVVPAAAPGEVLIRLADGAELLGQVDASRGGPERPLAIDDLVAKFTTNVGDDLAGGQLAGAMLDLASQSGVDAILRAASDLANPA